MSTDNILLIHLSNIDRSSKYYITSAVPITFSRARKNSVLDSESGAVEPYYFALTCVRVFFFSSLSEAVNIFCLSSIFINKMYRFYIYLYRFKLVHILHRQYGKMQRNFNKKSIQQLSVFIKICNFFQYLKIFFCFPKKLFQVSYISSHNRILMRFFSSIPSILLS